MTRRLSFAVVCLAATRVFADAPATMPAGLKVGGAVDHPLTLSPEDLAAMPHKTVQAKDHDGREYLFEGVLLRDVLLKAGLPLGQHRLKGPLLGLSVVTTSADGYRVAFGLAEFDAEYAERDILIADRREGSPLSAKEGPLRLVVPQEARQGRWARMLTTITVVAPPGP